MPETEQERIDFLSDLGEFIRTGKPGNFIIVEENLRDLYLVAIGDIHRISRKIYATHPLIPRKLLVIGGIGIVRPDEMNHRLTLQTPTQDLTLHQLFPDLAKTSMSAAHPTPQKTIKSIPNEDPVGGYSIRTAKIKYLNAEMISENAKGIDPLKFPVITNVTWGTIGTDLAFYVYAVPDNAIPVCELLHANNREEITKALDRYIHAGQQLMRALRHLHEAGYVFNQPHQGNVYYYQNEQGEDKILIADLDTLQSIKNFSRKVPEGRYLSPMAFATLVNIQVASTHIAYIAWIDFFRSMIRELGIDKFPGAEKVYASIICDLLAGYISIHKIKRAEIYSSIRRYYNDLCRQVQSGDKKSNGIIRLMRSDFYEIDVFGFIFTYILLNDEYCKTFGARLLTEGITQSQVEQVARNTIIKTKKKVNSGAIARVINETINQIIEERANEAMQEFIQGLSKRRRISRITSNKGT